MKPVISPKELAVAIGVSESSLKRWVDDGLIRVFRTAGGHRRIPVGEAIRFIRTSHATLVRPEVLGLPDLASARDEVASPEDVSSRLLSHLSEGRAGEARGLVLFLYLSGHSVAEIADGPIHSAMERLGELWRHDPAGIFIEHRATDIAVQAVQQLRVLVEPEVHRMVAVGAGAPSDPYVLPSSLCAAVLAAEGFQAINLGADTPFDTLLTAVERHNPRLVWFSVSSVRDAAEIEAGMQWMADRLAAKHVTLVLGGQVMPGLRTPTGPWVHVRSSLADLLAIAHALPHAGAASAAPGASAEATSP